MRLGKSLCGWAGGKRGTVSVPCQKHSGGRPALAIESGNLFAWSDLEFVVVLMSNRGRERMRETGPCGDGFIKKEFAYGNQYSVEYS